MISHDPFSIFKDVKFLSPLSVTFFPSIWMKVPFQHPTI